MRGTIDYDIMFNRQQSVPSVVRYVDADYARDLDDRRSTTSYVFTLGGGPICYKSMVQSLVSLSTREALWFVGLVKELGIQ